MARLHYNILLSFNRLTLKLILKFIILVQCKLKTVLLFVRVKGVWGSVVDFHSFVVSYRGEWQLLGTFFGMKRYCSWPKLSNFEISKMHTITLRARTLTAISPDFPTIFLKLVLLLQFLRQSLEIQQSCSRDFNETFCIPEFRYIGHRSENIEFRKSQIYIFNNFWRVDIF